MTKATAVGVLAAMLVLVALTGGATAACNAGSLLVCAPAIAGGSKPSAQCCSGLRSQQGCFCQLAKDPRYSGYVNNPNARKTLSACGIAPPHC